jgi:hypothetical protein
MVDSAEEQKVIGMVPTGLLIGGEWAPAENSATFAVEDPWTGKVPAEVADASPAEACAPSTQRQRDGRPLPSADGAPDRLGGAGGRRAARLHRGSPASRWSSTQRRPGFPVADPVIGLVITVAILLVLRDAAREVYRRLMDAVEPVLVDQAEHAIGSSHRVEHHLVHGVRRLTAATITSNPSPTTPRTRTT